MTLSNNSRIDSASVLDEIVAGSKRYGFLDVRSEGEFLDGRIDPFVNIPILNNEERKVVGITYKQVGQVDAIQRGMELVKGEVKESRIQKWSALTEGTLEKKLIVCCWRGGLRSKITCEWLNERGIETLRVDGGYKGMRKKLLETFSGDYELLVLSGHTGSGKTLLLDEIEAAKIDLEKLANHRGSSFGRIAGNEKQPTQATFENALGIEFLKIAKSGARKIIIEDESSFIGNVTVPKPVFDRKKEAPLVLLKVSPEDRARTIISEYILKPIGSGLTPALLKDHYLAALMRISEKLGGLKTSQIKAELEAAFTDSEVTIDRHFKWVYELLVHYYDPLYAYSFAKNERKILFQGNYKECLQWIKSQSV